MKINKTLVIFIVSCLVVLFTGCNGSPSEGPGVDNSAKTSDANMRPPPPPPLDKFEKVYKGHPKKRTWQVYFEMPPPPVDPHIRVGESFELEKKGNKIKLKPKGALKGRWNIDEMDLDEDSGDPDLLCGEIYLPHASQPNPVKHILSLQRKNDPVEGEILTVTYADEASGETCRSLGTHGGAAHLR